MRRGEVDQNLQQRPLQSRILRYNLQIMIQLNPNDPRVQPGPENDFRESRGLRLSDHRYQQMRAEVEDPANDLARQDIVDIALKEYFEKRYVAKG